MQKKKDIVDEAWCIVESLLGPVRDLEENGYKDSAEELRNIIGELENWCIKEKND